MEIKVHSLIYGTFWRMSWIQQHIFEIIYEIKMIKTFYRTLQELTSYSDYARPFIMYFFVVGIRVYQVILSHKNSFSMKISFFNHLMDSFAYLAHYRQFPFTFTYSRTKSLIASASHLLNPGEFITSLAWRKANSKLNLFKS